MADASSAKRHSVGTSPSTLAQGSKHTGGQAIYNRSLHHRPNLGKLRPLRYTLHIPPDRGPMSAISTIRNLGPATEAQFAKAGITTAEELRAMGADVAYLAWLKAGLPAHFIGYYVLVMALQDRPWNDCKGDEKKALRFDALKAQVSASGTVARDAALDFFGVIEGPKRPRP